LAGDTLSREQTEFEVLERSYYRAEEELRQRDEDERRLAAALAETEREAEGVRKRLADLEPEPEALRTWTVDPKNLTDAHHARLSARPEGALLLWAVTNGRLNAGRAGRARRDLLSWLSTPGAPFPLTEGQIGTLQRKHDALARAKQTRDARKAGQPKTGSMAFGDTWTRTLNEAAR
jgi:hypothetical protein